ncbi:MAG TPA: type III-B CRISPR module RAMP protein Cmr6, partial [Saprospiraceae bacterium]|nr:type III-B CRISPR module RAMP protein Cmr6 [Saprospiraceae bacterium]
FNFFNSNRGRVLYKIQNNFGDFDFLGQCQRIENQILKPYKKISFSPDWRMIVGLGDASVYETSITLHHIYGIPYIPASTIKGVIRSQVIKEIFLPKYLSDNDEKANEKAEDDAMKNSVFKLFFGNQDQKGKIIFYDAFPTSSPKIEVDVMNPHYGSYYSDTKAPVDSDSPTPIFFLTVTGCAFQFLISSKSKQLFEKYFDADSKKKTIIQWLTEALAHHGIGAKTAVGYGYMKQANH